jgi:hypothetical protein
MSSGGNRNSRMTVAASSDSRRSQEQFGSDDLEERSAELRNAEQHAWRNLGSTDSLPTDYADIRRTRDETLSLMTSLHQSHLDELEQQKFSQMLTDSQPTKFGNYLSSSPVSDMDLKLTEKQHTNDERKLPSFLSTESQPTNFENLSSSSVAGPVFIPGRESRSPSFRPAQPHRALGSNLTPFSNTLNPGSKLYESVERKARGGSDNVDNWRRAERDVKDAPAQMEFSSRKGRVSVDNITQRDSKRPSERPRDKEYHRRFSGGFPIPIVRNDAVYGLDRSPPPVPLGGQSWPNENSFSPPGRTVVQVDFHNNNRSVQPPILAGHTQPGLPPGQGNRGNGAYYISLICGGDTVQALVWPTMSIGELIEDAGSVFGLDPAGISLLLFTLPPVSLRRGTTISGPPLVAPDASVMVFSHQPPPADPVALRFGPHTPPYQGAVDLAIMRMHFLRLLLLR